MKQKLLKLGAFAAFLILGQSNILSAQTIGDFRSKGDGVWGGTVSNVYTQGNWEIYNDSGAWVDAATTPDATSNVLIRGGHTITLNGGTKSTNNITIENGGTLKSDGTLRNLRFVGSIINNGKFGDAGTNERVSIEGYRENGTMTITGTGTYLVGLIRTNGVVKVVDLVIDADLNMSSYLSGPYTFGSGTTNSELQGDDNVNIIINAGKTVTCGTASYLHAPSANTNISTDFLGSYTYTINGTLDMTTAATSCIVGHNTNNGTVTVNVNGTWKLGNAIRTASNNATLPTGLVFLNIGTNGIVDATVNTSTNGSNLVMANGATNLYTFFNIIGNGVIKQNPSKSTSGQNVFRIGTGGFYSPVTIGAASTPNAVFTVNVSNINDAGKKVVNRVWDISSNAVIPDLTLTFGSVINVEKNGFNITDPVLVYRYNSNAWGTGVNATAVATVANGAATSVDLHTTQLTLVNTLGKFSVGNETPAVLPLKFISVNAKINANGKQAFINWQTAEEKNTLDFVIEKSIDGVNFNQIGVIGAKSTAGLNSYNFTDNNVDAGTSYYRIKQRDNDGKSDISTVVSVKSKNQIVVNAFPNPTVSDLNIAYPLVIKGGKVAIYNLAGNKVLEQSLVAGSTSTKVGVAQLVPSIYILEVNTGDDTAVSRFVKQ